MVDFPSTKNWACLPLGDKNRREEIELFLRYFCQTRKGIYWGVARLSQPCSAENIGSERKKLFSRLVDVFEMGKKKYGVELFFAIGHEPVKTRQGAIRKDSTGHLLYGVHLHFLFLKTGDAVGLRQFIRYFERKFPKCSRIRRVNHKQRKVSYLLARPDFETILNEDQFADYYKGVGGSARIRCYGKFSVG